MRRIIFKYLCDIEELFKILLIITILYLVLQFLISTQLLNTVISFFKAITPLFWGVFIAFLLENNINRVEKKFKRFSACLIVYGFVVVVIIVSAFILLPVLYDEIEVIMTYIPQILETALKYIDTSKVSTIDNGLKTIVGLGADFAIKKLLSFTAFFSIVFSSFICATFISIDKKALLLFIDNHISFSIHFRNFINSCSHILNRYLIGMMYDLFILFISLYILFSLFSIKNSLFYAFFLTFMNMIPYFGPTFGFLFIAIIFYFASVPNLYVCLIIAWVIQQVEGNFIQPFIFKKTLYIKPILTFTTLLVMGQFLGIFGMVIAPVLAAIIQIAYRTFIVTKDNLQLAKWEDI